ncbi:hypothetical protein JL721_8257 [Aureococcus anophagefferens]|nr:hypothetical protein JL721_8257 [Aureococcus anophagefferens]
MADAHLETAEETELIARATAPTSTAEYNAANDFGDDDAPWSHPSGATIDVQNVVATVNLRISIDLRTLALSARNAEYNPKKFAAVIMRVREPRCTALVFSTGKMVITGAKSEDAARRGARKFAAIIRKIGFQPKFGEALVYAHAKFSSYEPELFPGLIYRLVIPKTVLLLFVSGRMVLTGGKSLGHLRTAFEKMYPVLTEFKKESLPYERRELRGRAASKAARSRRAARPRPGRAAPLPARAAASRSPSKAAPRAAPARAPRRRVEHRDARVVDGPSSPSAPAASPAASDRAVRAGRSRRMSDSAGAADALGGRSRARRRALRGRGRVAVAERDEERVRLEVDRGHQSAGASIGRTAPASPTRRAEERAAGSRARGSGRTATARSSSSRSGVRGATAARQSARGRT